MTENDTDAKRARLKISERIKTGKVELVEQQIKYYSSWYYPAVHALLSISEFQSLEVLSEKLRLDLKVIKETVDFLMDAGKLC